jgi:hypothetical protein
MLVIAAVRASIAAEPAISLEAAQSALSRGDAQRAVELFDQLAQQTISVPAEVGLVRASLQAGRFREAIAHADHLRGDHRESIEGAAMAAYLQDRIGRTEVALQQLDALQKRVPEHFAPLAARAEILIDRAHPQDARKLLENWRDRHAADARDADLLRLLDRARLAMGETPLRDSAGGSGGRWPAPAFRSSDQAAHARIAEAGNGIVMDGGSRVLTLRAIAARGGGRFLVRNSRGELRIARRSSDATSGELVRLDLEKNFPTEWSLPPERIATGDGVRFCFAFGYAVPGGPPAYPVFATGLLLRADTGDRHVMQITSALTAGHAGSPLFDSYGRLIGLALGPESKLSDGISLTPQLGNGQFAVPIEGARPAPVVRPGEKTPPQPQIEQLYEDLSPAIVEIVPLE